MLRASIKELVLVAIVDLQQRVQQVAAVNADPALLVERSQHDTDAHDVVRETASAGRLCYATLIAVTESL